MEEGDFIDMTATISYREKVKFKILVKSFQIQAQSPQLSERSSVHRINIYQYLGEKYMDQKTTL